MSGFFTLGETKDRPGVYKRFENLGTETPGATEKIAACVVSGNWGPLNTPVKVDHNVDVSTVLGSGSGADVLSEIFYDGPSQAIVVRVGSGGTVGSVTLKAKAEGSESSANALKVDTKYPTDRAFSITVKPALDDETVTEVSLYEGTRLLESRSLTGTDGVADFVEAFANSKYIDVTKLSGASGTLDTVTQAALAGGANPTVTNQSYSDGCAALEREVFHYVCVDTNDTGVHSILAAFIQRIYKDGAYGRAVVAEPKSVAVDVRMAHAQAFNDEKIIYVLNSWNGTNGVNYNGYLAAARICGMCAACPSNESLTHAAIKGASELDESLTNGQIKRGLNSGCLIISMSKNQQVIIEKAINTLVTLATNQDAGWKKIKRVDVRYELCDRIEKVVDPMIGKVNNDTNGRAAIIAAMQRVIDAMVGEAKLLSGSALLDTTNPPAGDSAWFTVTVDDIDSLEHIYLTFRFRFSQNS